MPEKINNGKLKQVLGGGILDSIPKKKVKCRMCEREFEAPNLEGMAIGMLMVGPQADEWRKQERSRAYYRDMCSDCAKKHPYQGE